MEHMYPSSNPHHIDRSIHSDNINSGQVIEIG
jgi:hypothetical protein